MSMPELSRLFDVRQVDRKQPHLEATESERTALAARFGLVRVDNLMADLDLARHDRVVEARGRLKAAIVQPCAVSADDLPVSIDEELFFRFVPAKTSRVPDEEVEINADDCDEIEYAGTHFDLGEAVAQSLGLAIDPYLTGPGADAARAAAGIGAPEDHGPFATLKGLKRENDG